MKSKKAGQVALVVLLLMSVILVIGLSLLSHSITDISISKDEEEAMRAFSAAEAGIEEALRQSDLSGWESPTPVVVGDLTANVTASESYVVNETIDENEFVNVNLAGGSNINSLNITWTGDVASEDAALEIVVYQNDSSTRRYAYKASDTVCASGFTIDADRSISIPIDLNGSDPEDELVRIRALCNGTTIQATGSPGTLPIQDYEIDSRAAAGGEKESKVSAIQVDKSLPELPPIFDYVLFTKGSL